MSHHSAPPGGRARTRIELNAHASAALAANAANGTDRREQMDAFESPPQPRNRSNAVIRGLGHAGAARVNVVVHVRRSNNHAYRNQRYHRKSPSSPPLSRGGSACVRIDRSRRNVVSMPSFGRSFLCDGVFEDEFDLQRAVATPHVDSAMAGQHSTLAVRGGEGSDKSKTLYGLFNASLEDLFRRISQDNGEHNYSVHMSCLENFEGSIYDILGEEPSQLCELVNDPASDALCLQKHRVVEVGSIKECERALETVRVARKTFHDRNARGIKAQLSHFLIRLEVTSTHTAHSDRGAIINFLDLADPGSKLAEAVVDSSVEQSTNAFRSLVSYMDTSAGFTSAFKRSTMGALLRESYLSATAKITVITVVSSSDSYKVATLSSLVSANSMKEFPQVAYFKEDSYDTDGMDDKYTTPASRVSQPQSHRPGSRSGGASSRLGAYEGFDAVTPDGHVRAAPHTEPRPYRSLDEAKRGGRAAAIPKTDGRPYIARGVPSPSFRPGQTGSPPFRSGLNGSPPIVEGMHSGSAAALNEIATLRAANLELEASLLKQGHREAALRQLAVEATEKGALLEERLRREKAAAVAWREEEFGRTEFGEDINGAHRSPQRRTSPSRQSSHIRGRSSARNSPTSRRGSPQRHRDHVELHGADDALSDVSSNGISHTSGGLLPATRQGVGEEFGMGQSDRRLSPLRKTASIGTDASNRMRINYQSRSPGSVEPLRKSDVPGTVNFYLGNRKQKKFSAESGHASREDLERELQAAKVDVDLLFNSSAELQEINAWLCSRLGLTPEEAAVQGGITRKYMVLAPGGAKGGQQLMRRRDPRAGEGLQLIEHAETSERRIAGLTVQLNAMSQQLADALNRVVKHKQYAEERQAEVKALRARLGVDGSARALAEAEDVVNLQKELQKKHRECKMLASTVAEARLEAAHLRESLEAAGGASSASGALRAVSNPGSPSAQVVASISAGAVGSLNAVATSGRNDRDQRIIELTVVRAQVARLQQEVAAWQELCQEQGEQTKRDQVEIDAWKTSMAERQAQLNKVDSVRKEAEEKVRSMTEEVQRVRLEAQETRFEAEQARKEKDRADAARTAESIELRRELRNEMEKWNAEVEALQSNLRKANASIAARDNELERLNASHRFDVERLEKNIEDKEEKEAVLEAQLRDKDNNNDADLQHTKQQVVALENEIAQLQAKQRTALAELEEKLHSEGKSELEKEVRRLEERVKELLAESKSDISYDHHLSSEVARYRLEFGRSNASLAEQLERYIEKHGELESDGEYKPKDEGAAADAATAALSDLTMDEVVREYRKLHLRLSALRETHRDTLKKHNDAMEDFDRARNTDLQECRRDVIQLSSDILQFKSDESVNGPLCDAIRHAEAIEDRWKKVQENRRESIAGAHSKPRPRGLGRGLGALPSLAEDEEVDKKNDGDVAAFGELSDLREKLREANDKISRLELTAKPKLRGGSVSMLADGPIGGDDDDSDRRSNASGKSGSAVGRIAELEAEIEVLNAKVEVLEARIVELQANGGAAHGEDSASNGNDASGQISELQERIRDLKVHVDTLEQEKSSGEEKAKVADAVLQEKAQELTHSSAAAVHFQVKCAELKEELEAKESKFHMDVEQTALDAANKAVAEAEERFNAEREDLELKHKLDLENFLLEAEVASRQLEKARKEAAALAEQLKHASDNAEATAAFRRAQRSPASVPLTAAQPAHHRKSTARKVPPPPPVPTRPQKSETTLNEANRAAEASETEPGGAPDVSETDDDDDLLLRAAAALAGVDN